MIRIRRGDLLSCGASVLVCPTNTVGVMGAGLAAQFAAAHPGLEPPYRAACAAGAHAPESPVVWSAPSGQLVRCLATKRHWRSAARLADVETCLWALGRFAAAEAAAGRVHTIALPALGCGLGGLSWAQVAPLVAQAACALRAVGLCACLTCAGGQTSHVGGGAPTGRADRPKERP